jgi:eukaryotic-like serine/threonine-protein kinase
LLIEGHYYIDITGELDKAAQAYEVGKQAFPRDAAFSRNLIFVYSRLGDYEKAAAEASENLLRDAGNGMNYSNLGGDYLDLNRFQDAEAVYKDAESRHLDGEWLLGNRYNLAFVQGDTAQMEKLVAAAQGKPGYEDLLLATHSDTLAWYGKLHGAREMTHRAIESAVRNDASETAALYQSAAALRDVESGDRERAHDQVQAAMKLASNRDVQAVSALVLARVGGSGAQLEALTAGLEKQFPVDTMVQKYWLPSIRAAAAMQRGQANQAVEELRVSIPYDLASPSNATAVLVPVYLRGQAYLMLRQGAAARAEFQKLVDHRGLAGNFQWAVLARLGVARAYALDAQSDSAAREKARAAYQEFLTLWKDADPDIPIYQEAKAEYARLMAVGP